MTHTVKTILTPPVVVTTIKVVSGNYSHGRGNNIRIHHENYNLPQYVIWHEGCLSIQLQDFGYGINTVVNFSPNNVYISQFYSSTNPLHPGTRLGIFSPCKPLSVYLYLDVRFLVVSTGRLVVFNSPGPCLRRSLGGRPWLGRLWNYSLKIGGVKTLLFKDNEFGGQTPKNNVVELVWLYLPFPL